MEMEIGATLCTIHNLHNESKPVVSIISLQNVYKRVRFNTTGECEAPLVATNNERSWYDTVEGCGIQCTNPLYTDEQHEQVHLFIAIFATLCLVCTCFTLVSITWCGTYTYKKLFICLC